jgi:hypothetical protein
VQLKFDDVSDFPLCYQEFRVSEIVDSIFAHGAGVFPGFLSSDSLTGLQAETDRLTNGEYALHFPKSTRVRDLYRHGQLFLNLLTDVRLNTLLTELLGQHPVLSDYSINIVHPHQPPDTWHVDYPYNEMLRPVTGGVLSVQCILNLDAFTPDNGATHYIPSSHQLPTHPDTQAAQDHQVLCADAGTLIVMASSTWHRAGHNTTDSPRRAILFTFVEHWVRPLFEPPEPGPWSTTDQLRLLLGMQYPPTIFDNLPARHV